MKSIVGDFVCDTATDPQSRQLFMSGLCGEIQWQLEQSSDTSVGLNQMLS